jgi:hypothetical protein
MRDQRSAVVFPFPAVRRAPGSPARGRASLGNPHAAADGAGDAALPADNVIVLSERARWRMRRPGSCGVFPPPGGEAA